MENSDEKLKKNNLNSHTEETNGDNFSSQKSSATDLTSTVGAFSSLIQAKIKEQEIKVGEIEQATQSRHNLMLVTLMNIRKSLLDVTRIDLGERYYFEQANDDWQGWPRLRILLKDSQEPEVEFPIFQVTAHDRNTQGNIEIAANSKEKPLVLSLVNPNDLARLPSSLKKTVRIFLDNVSEIILNRENIKQEQEDERVYLENKDLSSFEDSGHRMIDDDLFMEDNVLEDFLEKLPQMSSLERLPTVDESLLGKPVKK